MSDSLARRLTWSMPALRPHAGALLGNATQGLMVWGTETCLKITVGRSGFWDHRWGNNFSSGITYQALRDLLEAGDEDGLRAAFAKSDDGGTISENQRPHQLGAGCVEVVWPAGWRCTRLDLDLETAILHLVLEDAAGQPQMASLRQSMHAELAWLQLPPDCPARIGIVPVWHYLADELTALGCGAPEQWEQNGTIGVIQSLPEDDPLALAVTRRDTQVVLATALGPEAKTAVETVLAADVSAAGSATDDWWRDYWRSVPQIHLPDDILQELCDYGLYKLACCTAPQGVACTLQGPFLEDYQVPPWSCDYHFNINIQMIYWPVLAAGRFEHFKPLWDLIMSWEETLRQHAKVFFGSDDAFMLPHAVDDRCQAVGSFWTGTIDHACTSWMAQMAWLHYRYSGEREVLETVAWPMLVGAFGGYWAMLEEIDDGNGGARFSLPVSVSPEFKGAAMDAWGRDASFQLAALHMTIASLTQAAAELGKEPDPRWGQVAESLPPYSLVAGPMTKEHGGQPVQRIGLWEGMDLIDSHRHHSHLGGIYPFCTIDPRDPAHAKTVASSLFHWVRTGPGGWSGWCVPWAAIINARVDRSDAAIGWLHWFYRTFTNEGRGTLHDAAFPGQSTLGSQRAWYQRNDEPNREVMQLDGGFGCLNAVFELLVQQRHDGIHILPGLSYQWQDLSFDGIHTEGGFVIGATVADGAVQSVRVRATRAGDLCLVHGLGASWRLDGAAQSGPVLAKQLAAGETLLLEAGD